MAWLANELALEKEQAEQWHFAPSALAATWAMRDEAWERVAMVAVAEAEVKMARRGNEGRMVDGRG